MTVDAIAAVGGMDPAALSGTLANTKHLSENSFAQWLDEQIGSTDSKVKLADQSVQKLITGDTDNLHRVMMDIESARFSLDLVVQVRNRVVEAYQELMRMQV